MKKIYLIILLVTGCLLFSFEVHAQNPPGTGYNSILYTQYNGTRNANTTLLFNNPPAYILKDNDAAVQVYDLALNQTLGNPTSITPNHYMNNSNIWGEDGVSSFSNRQYMLDAYWAATQYLFYLQNHFNCPKEFFQREWHPQTNSWMVDDTLTPIFMARNTYNSDTYGSAFWEKITYQPRTKAPSQPYDLNTIIVCSAGTTHRPGVSIDEITNVFSQIFSNQAWIHDPNINIRNINYLNETSCNILIVSMALADIWSAIITHSIYPNNEDKIWKIGEDIVLPGHSCIRNLANPTDPTAEMPMNANDCNGTLSNIYAKSGVISHWFYLLTHGFSGTGCDGCCYDFSAVPIDTAAKLIYYCEIDGFNIGSTDYWDICKITYNKAKEIFSNSPQIWNSVLLAWNSLGVHINSDSDIEKFGLTLNSSNNGTYYISDSLIVEPSEVLTVSGKLCMSPSAFIKIKPGGKFILNGGIITVACPNTLWQGIFIEGNKNQRQLDAYQGIVELKNGAIIEHALNAISTSHSTGNSSKTGGIIRAQNTTFRNNKRSVEMLSYENHDPRGTVINNVSYFDRCKFVVNGNNHFSSNGSLFSTHVSLWEVRGVTFTGCTFIDSLNANFTPTPTAIYSLDASAKIEEFCPINITLDCDCESSGEVNSSFYGFNKAIHATTSGSSKSTLVRNANFTNNVYGIYIEGEQNTKLYYNNIDLNQAPNSASQNFGISLNSATNYTVEENNIHRSYPSTPISYGISVSGSGISNNSLFKNSISGTNYGINISGTNGNTATLTGLQCTCNNFTSNNYSIYAQSSSTMRPSQGASNKGADNDFVSTNYRDIFSLSNQYITYYFSNNTYHTPYNYAPTNRISLVGNASSNFCLSTLCNSFIITPVYYMGLQNHYDSLKGVYDLNHYEDILQNAERNVYKPEIIQEAKAVQQALSDLNWQMSSESRRAVQAILSDSLIDYELLEEWYTLNPDLSAKYALSEILFEQGKISDAEYALSNIRNMLISEDDFAEYENYMDFFKLKKSLTKQYSTNTVTVDWPSASKEQINELQNIAGLSSGRSSTMAKGVLCFFFDICYEDPIEIIPDLHDNKIKSLGNNTVNENFDVTIAPNPASERVTVSVAGEQMLTKIEIFNVSGHLLITKSAKGSSDSIDISKLQSGIYFLNITLSNGSKEKQKFVKL